MTRPVSAATLPVIRALLDEASRKDYHAGVLGVRARPEWAGAPEFTHADTGVRVVPCASVLAVREAITGRDRSQWLVVLTDRPDEDLGAGIRAHLVGHRLRTPDPWDAVRQHFAATGIDPALTAAAGHREIATGLLAAAPAAGWPPAPAGVLTRDHAFAAVADARLVLTDPVVDLASVLGWTTDPALATRIADLREMAGNPLTDAVLAWAAGCCGAVSAPLLQLLRAGEARDTAPLGLVAGLLAAAAYTSDPLRSRLGREGLIRLEPRLGGHLPGSAALISWAGESAAAIIELLGSQAGQPRGEALLARADQLLAAAHAEGLAGQSDLLPSGLSARLAALADVLRSAFAEGAGRRTGRPDDPWISPDDLAGIEQAWSRVAEHQLAGPTEPRTAAFHAAVRLSRWLAASSAAPAAAGTTAAEVLSALISRHGTNDAWADSAVNDAAPGVSDPELGTGLAAVLTAAAARRAAHDVAFAAALAQHTADDEPWRTGGARTFWPLEDLLPDVVLPLASKVPVLLLVLDGMSSGVATELLASLLARSGDGWAEALLPGQGHRASGLAVLPTITEVSRASLLCGRLRTGDQGAEKAGYERLLRDYGVRGGHPFHKKPLDSSLPGFAVAPDVASAIADVTGQQLVSCVLNTIDDALDRSDPGGTEWTTAAVRHLLPLLDRARHAGRTVILTADHGHVIERRQGVQRSYPDMSSGRSRPASGASGPDEVLVAGSRVLLHGGRAILAVDERLRYGPLKAGYHGGASAAEAVVPVAVLVPGSLPDDSGLQLAPPQEPSWWTDPVAVAWPGASAATAAAASGGKLGPDDRAGSGHRGVRRTDPRLRAARGAEPTLFDTEPVSAEPPAPAAGGGEFDGQQASGFAGAAGEAATASAVAGSVVRSAAYTAQRRIGGRLSVPDDRVRDLLAALLAAPATRLPPVRAAAALQVAPVSLRGAVLHVQRLLNVDGYPVLRIDADGATVILDEPLLREQFGIRG